RNRDDVRRDVRRHVTGLRLDDRERRERATRVRVLHHLELVGIRQGLASLLGLFLRTLAAVELAVDARAVERLALLHDGEDVRHLRGALEEARVQVEDVARIRLAARRTAQEQRELAVRDGLLAEVIEDAERVATGV